MKSLFLLAALAATGCAGTLTSTLDQPPAPANPVQPLAPADVPEWSQELAQDLSDSLDELEARGRVSNAVRIEFLPEKLFEPQSALLRASALAVCAALVENLRKHAGGTLQVRVNDGADADLEPGLRLAARRAASLRQAFANQGLAVEVQSELSAEPARVLMTIEPVIELPGAP